MTRPFIESQEGAPVVLEGYILVDPNSGAIAGSRGEDPVNAALSKEIAEEIIASEAEAGRTMELRLVSHARFIKLPGNRIYDSRNQKTHESLADLNKWIFATYK